MKKVVNVRTQKEWDIAVGKLKDLWSDAEWSDYKEDTCIHLDNCGVASKDFYIEAGYEVISFDEFMGNKKSKKYELIITNTNKVIILDKEMGKKGQATCHKDDVFDAKIGINLAWDRLNGADVINHKNGNPLNNEVSNLEVKPQPRRIKDLPVGTKIRMLSKIEGWTSIKKDDIGTLVNINSKAPDGDEAVVINFNDNKKWILKSKVKEGEYFEVVEEVKKPILTESDTIINGIVEKNPLTWGEIFNKIDENVKIGLKLENDTVSISKSLYEEFIKWKDSKEAKLYDSFGEELKEDDSVILINTETNEKCFDRKKEYYKICRYNVWQKKEGIFTNGIESSHNSNTNKGYPTDRWKVIKVK